MKKSIRKLEIIEQMEENGQLEMLTKKEALMLLRKKEKLNSYLEGFRHMKKLPDMMFVIDAVKEHIAVKEAKRMGMKVVAPLDTNCDPDVIDYPIPGNDDAIRSINLFCKEIADAIIEGKAAYAEANGEDVDTAPSSIEVEEMVAEAKEEAAAAPEATEAPAAEKAGDDLTKLKGVGKVYAEKLNNEGFNTFADVANMTDEQVQVMEEKYSFKGDFKETVAHAKELAEA
jgi:small subunit ribosomal protein S2